MNLLTNIYKINSCIFLGILGEQYNVKYAFTDTCAPTGSVVDIRCTYTYPTQREVDNAFWFVKWEQHKEPEDLCESEDYRNRAEYVGNKDHNCTLKIKDLRETDSQKYRFRFLTDDPAGKYAGKEVTLSVTGNYVTLTASMCVILWIESTQEVLAKLM